MRCYRQKLFEAVYALAGAGDLNMRLTQAAGCLIQLDDSDIPHEAFARFEQLQDLLIEKPLVSKGEMIPRDLGEVEAIDAAHGIVKLLVNEIGES